MDIEQKPRPDQSSPKGLPMSLILGVLVFGLVGSARGLEEGTVSGSISQESFQIQFGFLRKTSYEIAEIKSNIASMVVLSSIGGTIIAFMINDFIGRIRTLQTALILWVIGVIIQITTFGGIQQIYSGKFISGLGIGMTVVVCPIYLVEISPKKIRGRCTNVFAGSVYLGIMIGYFANWGTSVHFSNNDRNQWVIPISVQLIWAGLTMIGTLFIVESPRWLLKKGRDIQGESTLVELRNVDKSSAELAQEIGQIYAQIREEQSQTHSKLTIIKQIFKGPGNRHRLILGILIQTLAQWSGATAVTVYAPELFQIVGISHEKRLFASSMLGVVKLVSALTSAVFVIDYFGRKKALYSGISLQLFSLVYLAVFISFKQQYDINPALTKAGVPAIMMIYINGVGWALGWNSVQYLFNAEVFPTGLRSIASGIIVIFHFVNQYACSKATPVMFLALYPWGTMAFFAAVTFIGLLYCIFLVPEVSGATLEHISNLFLLPWYRIGRVSRHMYGDNVYN